MRLNTFFSMHCLSYQSVQQYGSKSTQNWILTEQRLHIISLCKFKLQISNWIILKQSKKSDWVSSRKAMEINNRWNVIFIKTIIILKFLHFKRNIKLMNILNFRITKSHFLFSLYIGQHLYFINSHYVIDSTMHVCTTQGCRQAQMLGSVDVDSCLQLIL